MSATLTPADASAKLLDVQAVAEMLGCSTRHVHRLSDAGKMPSPLKLGALVRWSKNSIEQWIAEGCPACRRRTATSTRASAD
jgi:excisionase family DNA binding protein